MELVLDPVTLAGLAGFTALTGWALGRAQAGVAAWRAPGGEPAPRSGETAADAEAPTDRAASGANQEAELPAPCQQLAMEERRAIFERPFALAELHDQVSSIRRDERILEGVFGVSGPAARFGTSGDSCRYVGCSGQPTCPRPADDCCHEARPGTASAPFARADRWAASAPPRPPVSRPATFGP